MNSTGNARDGAYRVSAMQMTLYCWQKVSGQRNVCWKAVQNIWKGQKGIYIRVDGKSWKKVKDKLHQFTSRSRCGSIIRAMEKIKDYMRGWLSYHGMAEMKNNIESLKGWMYRRIRMCIWKQWKLPKTRRRKLKGLGLPEWQPVRGHTVENHTGKLDFTKRL